MKAVRRFFFVTSEAEEEGPSVGISRFQGEQIVVTTCLIWPLLWRRGDNYCPTLKAAVKTDLLLDVEAVIEIVINSLTKELIAEAMRAGIHAIAEAGVAHITAWAGFIDKSQAPLPVKVRQGRHSH